MNVLDSELVAAELVRAGYQATDDRRRADLILFNTCSVRQHAEDKVYSALGRLKHLKEHHPDRVIGVIGCMAQKDRELIFRRAPHVDLVVGPGQLGKLTDLLDRLAAGAGPQIEVSLDRGWKKGTGLICRNGPEGASHKLAPSPFSCSDVQQSFVPLDHPERAADRLAGHQAMVRIMFGCNKFCSYCIVPSVRGPEQSRPVGEIESEARRLVDGGCLEITLLGQTVNSYRHVEGERTYRLADLLERLDAIQGLRRLKFVTNYPLHMTDDLIRAVRDLPSVSPYFHVPAQSGSDRILKRMRRAYTAGSYREMLDRIRQALPGAAVTSDFIVGFCGESEEDFQRTAELVREARFKNSFIFKYSTRPGTKSHELYADDVPYRVKQRRNNELLAIQNAISEEDNRPLLGHRVEILVEGPSKTSRKRAESGAVVQLTGRTVCDRIVVFDGGRELIGRLITVTIRRAGPFTLFGELVGCRVPCPRLRGHE